MQTTEWRTLAEETRFGPKKMARGSGGMVISSNSTASAVGADMLRAGGNACDAALAIAITQTVVEPHMSTITGVLSLLYYDADAGKTTYMNGGMNAPLAALPGFSTADIGTGRAVAVPGWWAGFEAVLHHLGTRSKREIMLPAIELAREGFEIYPFLFGEMFAMLDTLGRTEQGQEMFFPQGSLLTPGETLRQSRAAHTLERLCDAGSDYFYRGEFADKLIETANSAGGVLTYEDFERYQVRWQEPAAGTYRGYRLAAAPPPDHGGSHLIEAFNMLELLDLRTMGLPTESADTLYYMMRIAELVKDEGARQPDPATHYFPLDTILSKEYARIRLDLLRMEVPPPAPAPTNAPPGTNHVTVIDAQGNIASLLHSCVSQPWANGLFCEGVSVCGGGVHFLRTMPGPGERASLFISPNIIFDGEKPVLASGSPSISLIANIVQNTVNILDFGMSVDESVLRPRFGTKTKGPHEGQMIEVTIDKGLRQEVERRGVKLDVVSPWHFLNGSFEGIHIDPESGEKTACGDPRRNSTAIAV